MIVASFFLKAFKIKTEFSMKPSLPYVETVAIVRSCSNFIHSIIYLQKIHIGSRNTDLSEPASLCCLYWRPKLGRLSLIGGRHIRNKRLLLL